jgi:UDP-glucose 4-epimerase
VNGAAYTGKSALVAGGLGFIGSNLAIRLVELGARVTVVDSLLPDMGGNPFNLAPVAEEVEVSDVDLRDTARLAPLLRGQDVVFNLAGQVSHVDSMTDPVADLDINCRGQLSLLEACRRECPGATVVFAASRQQYGRPRYLPVDEAHPLDAVDVNGVHKTAAEAALLLYGRVYGLRGASLRLTNTYGPRMQIRHPRQGFVAWFVRLALEGRELELMGGGSTIRDFNHVDDVVEAFVACGVREEAVGEVFNLGSEPVTLREFAEALLEAAGGGSVRAIPFPEDRARIEIGDVHCDWRKINGTLGWAPTVSLAEGLARTVEYYRAHREHYL